RLAVVILDAMTRAEPGGGGRRRTRERHAAGRQTTGQELRRRPRTGYAADDIRADRDGARTGVQLAGDQQRQERRVARPVPVAVGAVDVLAGHEGADQPVEAVGRAGQPELLGQVLELEAVAAVIHAIEQVG